MNPTRSQSSLRSSLRAGAIYDLALGVFIISAGPGVFARLGHPLGEGLFLFVLSTLPLFLLPVLYLAASRVGDPGPFRLPVLWARGGGGALILLAVALLKPDPAWIFVLVGLGDLGWAGVHLILWRS